MGCNPFSTFLFGKVEGQEKWRGLQLLRQGFLNGMQKYPLKQPNLKKKNKKKYNLIRKKRTAEKKKKKLLRSIKVQLLEKEESLCMCEKEGEVAVIEGKEAKGDKINSDYLVESRHLTALSDS